MSVGDQAHFVTHSGDPGLGNVSLLVITNIATLSTGDKVRRSKKVSIIILVDMMCGRLL